MAQILFDPKAGLWSKVAFMIVISWGKLDFLGIEWLVPIAQ